jgi:hypothetical protein
MSRLYATFQTNEISYLTSCIKTGSYGESDRAFLAPKFDVLKDLRHIKPGDRVFIHLRGRLFCGPFFISDPHPGFIIDESVGSWHKVDFERTPEELRPVWLAIKPWCFFFDRDLSAQVNYCDANLLLKAGFRLPPLGSIGAEIGERLWQFIDEHGNPFSDFLQRQGAFAFRGFAHAPTAQFHQAALAKQLITQNEKSIPYRTKNGILVRSKSEMLIANFLHDRGYRFEYERVTVLGTKLLRPDFYLPDYDVFLEHLGLIDSRSAYREDWEWKKALYDANNCKVITTFENDIRNLESSLLQKLVSYGCFPKSH